MGGLDGIGLNAVDALIVLVTLASILGAFAQGFIRQVLYLLSTYIALVVASQYHRALGLYIGLNIPASDAVLSGFAFAAIFLVTMVLMLSLSHQIYNSTLVPQVGAFDNLGGAVVGIATAFVILTVSLAVLNFATGDIWPEYNGFRLATAHAVGESRLARVVGHSAPVVFTTLRPWLPGGLPAIFTLP